MRGRAGFIALLAAVSLLAASCRSDVGPGGPAVRTDFGVTATPCPAAVDPSHGCIYLGGLSDLSRGPTVAEGRAFTLGQAAFWERVNRAGGVGGFEVDVATFLRDGQSDPRRFVEQFEEIEPRVLGLAQSLGLTENVAIDGRLREERMAAVPGTRSSRWVFSPMLFESGASYCLEAMNGIDWASEELGSESLTIVHRGDDTGEDAAAGAREAAVYNGLDIEIVRAPPRATNTGRVVRDVLANRSDLVYLATDPADTGTLAQELSRRGYRGALMAGRAALYPEAVGAPAAPRLRGRYFVTAPWGPLDSASPGHQALRTALGARAGTSAGDTNAVTAGWVSSYPILAGLRAALAAGDLTRLGFTQAIDSLHAVDYEGMLPPDAANFAAEPTEAAVRTSLIARVDPGRPSGLAVVGGFFTGSTAEAFDLARPCSYTLE